MAGGEEFFVHQHPLRLLVVRPPSSNWSRVDRWAGKIAFSTATMAPSQTGSGPGCRWRLRRGRRGKRRARLLRKLSEQTARIHRGPWV